MLILHLNRLNIRRVAAWLAAALAAQLVAGAAAAELKPGGTFPDLGAFKLEGKVPESLAGKVVLVDFWASWCVPCKQSFPVLEELHRRHGARGLVVIAINEDEKRADMERFLKKTPATFTIARDAGQKLVAQVGVETMPSSFLVDRAGKVRFTHSGYYGEETRKQYEQEIETLLKESEHEK